MADKSSRRTKASPTGADGRAAARTETETPRRRWRALILGNLAMAAFSPVLGLFAGFLLVFGGIFLAAAWQIGAQPLIDYFHYAPYTATASGRIVESWTALEFDPADMPVDKLYWQPRSKIATCAVVEYAGDWSASLRRAFCGNRFQFSDDFRFDDWKTLAPGIPFAFQRDASGFAIQEIRLSKAAFDWLGSHPPNDTFMLSKPPPATALAALQEHFDTPFDIAVASWTTPIPSIPLAYDPKFPDQAMPAKFVDDRRGGFWFAGLIFALLFAIPGIFVWRLGIGFLFVGQSATIGWLLTLIPLVALPWWGDVLPQIVRHANRNWADVAADMLDDLSRVTRLIASTPAEATLAHGERIVWHLDRGEYADTFGRVHFSVPQPLPATGDAVLAALRAQAAEQVGRFAPEDQAALFNRLSQDKEAGRDKDQMIFTTAAEAVERDAHSDPAVRRAVRHFLIFGAGYNVWDVDALEKASGAAAPDSP